MPEKYSWMTGMTKGARSVAEYAVAIGICAGIDAAITRIDSESELLALGIPSVAVGITLFCVRMFVNWWKVKRQILAAGRISTPKV
jgi:hypothetical protein